jgi:SAM-dependent methyltransferase
VSAKEFDFEGVFDHDYLYFYEDMLTPERSDADTALIASLLGVPPGAEILDAPCGHGRIANRLASRGFRVTGLDASELFLDVARRESASQGVDVEYVHGDLRALPWSGRFDAIVNWFTSFGYFGDAQDRDVLRGFRRALKPGGVLLLELQSRDRIMRSMPPTDWPPRVVLQERGDDLMIDRISCDAVSGINSVERIIVRNGRVRRTHFVHRSLTFPEIRDWLLDAGFAGVSASSPDGKPFTYDSPRMIVLAHA